jgi:hypothetical protein
VLDLPAGPAVVTYRRGTEQHTDRAYIKQGETASSLCNFLVIFEAVATPQPTPGAAVPDSTASPPSETASEVTRDGRTWEAGISDFIRSFVAASDASDAKMTAAYYAETAFVLGRRRNQEEIRADVNDYNVRWPVRRDSIKGDIDVQQEEPEQTYSVSYVQEFYTENAGRTVWMKGEVKVDAQVNIIGGLAKITSISQKTLSREQGKLAATPITQPSLLRAIPVAGKPGIVRSPYAPSKGELNVRKHKKGSQVRCPYTGKVFIVP